MNTTSEFSNRANELVAEWMEDDDKILSAFSQAADKIQYDDESRESFALIVRSANLSAIGATLYTLMIKDMKEDASEDVAQEMEKEDAIHRRYQVEGESESNAAMRDAGMKIGDFS